MKAVREAFSAYAETSRDRFLRLGDTAALAFHAALTDHFRQEGSNPHPDGRILLLGGAFWDRALARGLITAEGKPTVASALFAVLFEHRWRLLGGLPPDDDFTPDERRLLLDFQVRFLEPTESRRRLKAVKTLAALAPGYDAVTAEARVRYEAGERAAALKRLEQARDRGRDDRTIRNFIQTLKAELQK